MNLIHDIYSIVTLQVNEKHQPLLIRLKDSTMYILQHFDTPCQNNNHICERYRFSTFKQQLQNLLNMSSNQELVLFNPNQLQNRPVLALPTGWSTASKTLTSFTCFSELPAELRVAIYKIELSRPRILTISEDTSKTMGMSLCMEWLKCDCPNVSRHL